MDRWTHVAINSPNGGVLGGQAVCPEASGDLISAIEFAMYNQLPFPLLMPGGDPTRVIVTQIQIVNPLPEKLDITTFGQKPTFRWIPATKDREVTIEFLLIP